MSNANREAERAAGARPTIDLLTLLADDKQIIAYRPRWNGFTKSVNATIVLQQIIYRWIGNGRRPFYKFTRPCDHPQYRPGDSWEEELGMTRRAFETARNLIAARTRGEIDPTVLVSYWVNRRHKTWYALNEPLLLDKLAAIYPQAEGGVAGIQVSLPEPDSWAVDNSASINGGNAHRSASSMAEMYIDDADQWRKRTSTEAINGGNVHRSSSSMAESAISINKEYSSSNNNNSSSKNTTATTRAGAKNARPDTAVGAVAATEQAILDWIGFEDLLNEKDRKNGLALADLLGWAFWIKLESPRLEAAGKNAIGIARSNWRKGKAVQADLRELAEVWLAMSDEERDEVLFACGRYGYLPDRLYLPEDFPHYVPYAALKKLYRALDGEIVPPALMPPVEDDDPE